MNKEEEGNNITKSEITETESKMVPKSNENNAVKTKGSFSKIGDQSFSKNDDYIAWKSKSGFQINIPLSDTSMRSRSCEKNFKAGSIAEEKLQKIEHNRALTIMPVSENQINSKDEDPALGVLEKFGQIFQDFPEKELKNESLSHNTKKTDGKEFVQLLPFCEKELRKIKEVFLTTIYCCLTMRANLLQYFASSLPDANKCQFYAEDKKLLKSFDQVKISTMAEEDNLLDLVKSLLIAREKTKTEYEEITESDTKLTEKTEGEKQDTSEIPEKEVAHENEKLQNTETLEKQENAQLFLAENQDSTLSLSKANPSSIAEKKKKSGTNKLKTVQKEYEALKAKYLSENQVYEKTIKELENVLEEKKRKLKQEKESKNQLLKRVSQLQAKQKRLGEIIGHEQMKYYIGQSPENREIMRTELWEATIRTILKGFFTQIKNLEIKRNKMLLHLRASDMPLAPTSIYLKEFEALKTKYWSEIETYDIIIKELEIPLEENMSISIHEKEMKGQLLKCMTQLQAQQKRLGDIINKEQLNCSTGQLLDDREKMQRELWLKSLRIILKGFMTQIKNLVLERNKMLLQLRVNDTGNLKAVPASIKKDFEALRAKFWAENELYEKTIKELESLLNRKKKIMKQEEEVKNQLLTCMSQLQTQQKRMGKIIGHEQLKCFTGHSSDDREKRREELWLAATRIILKGFSAQLKNLETEKDKMLRQLHANDRESFNAKTASIIQKDNLAKNIKQQIMYFKTAYKEKINKEKLDVK